MCLDGYGNFLSSQGKSEEAVVVLRKALNISKEVLGKDHEQVRCCCNFRIMEREGLGEVSAPSPPPSPRHPCARLYPVLVYPLLPFTFLSLVLGTAKRLRILAFLLENFLNTHAHTYHYIDIDYRPCVYGTVQHLQTLVVMNNLARNTHTHTHTHLVLYCTVLYCIVLYCIVLYCIVLGFV